MIKCFLSHSSRDKDPYVRAVAARIKREAKVFDEETFEKGMSPVEEIVAGLDASTLFVIFLSDAALESEWVKSELFKAKSLLDASQLERIYPIIIDPRINHNDSRIPDWMKESLNIQPVLKSAIAARKINARLTEISWKFHPRLKERKEIFVGRNSLTSEIEERFDDFSRPTPAILIVAGLPSIGRKALIQYSTKKANLIRESYEFAVVSLSEHDGIEDFVLKICDLGIASIDNVRDKLNCSFPEKIELAKSVVCQIAVERERIIIEDRGVLVQGNGEIVDWLVEIGNALAPHEWLTFCIASQFRPRLSINRTNSLFFVLHIKELEMSERNGLLTRYAKFQELEITRDDFSFFSDLLTGYPEQVLFAVDLIKDVGVYEAKKQSHTIQQYGSDKAKIVLDNFKGDDVVLGFVYFLARFEFISYDVLFDIVDDSTYFPILEKLIASSICERMGASADYIRVNEVIRDFISRSRFGLPTSFENAIKKHVSGFLERYQDDNFDISDYIFSAQEALRLGQDIPDALIVPSVFIKTIKKLYDEDRNYDEALALVDRVLLREQFLHKNMIDHIRFIKCQCLARLRDGRFFGEVGKIAEPSRSFLYGFYYRLSGDYEKAAESLNSAISKSKGKRDPRVLGELILVYMQSDEYELAYDLAKENYVNRPGNLLNANNYFACLIMREKTQSNRDTLNNILDRLALDPSERAKEILNSAKARMLAYYDGDEAGSMTLIDETIHQFHKENYPILTKADLAVYFGNKEKLREAVEHLEKITSRNAQSFRTFVRFKAMYLAMSNDLSGAKALVRKELKGLIPSSLKRLNERLEGLVPKQFPVGK
jgi:tetratricopeptide (TPR) repeat protein